MIRKDELAPSRRRRFYDMYASYSDSIGKLTYPAGGVLVDVSHSLLLTWLDRYKTINKWVDGHALNMGAGVPSLLYSCCMLC